MKKYIYKLTNLINGKIYIGQTNNLKRRMQEHMHDKRDYKPIHNALNKYGMDNFQLEILYFGEDYNKEEKKWIKYYNSNDKNYGYNITKGGQDSGGEDNPASKITQKQANDIIQLLLSSQLSFSEISQITSIPSSLIKHINIGASWRDDVLYSYPLRTNRLSNETVESVRKLLATTSKSIDEIVRELNIKRYIVLNINKGAIYKDNTLRYPIRELGLSKDTLNKIIDLLKNTSLYYKEIAEITNTSLSIVANINYGNTWKTDGVIYPIRNK